MSYNHKGLSSQLYRIFDLTKNISATTRDIVKNEQSRRLFKWEVVGAAAYAIPIAIRSITKQAYIGLPTIESYNVFGMLTPTNLVEKAIINSLYPGGAGAVAGEILIPKILRRELGSMGLHLTRMVGAGLQTLGHTLIQYYLNNQRFLWPHGEPPETSGIYPFNFLWAVGVAACVPYFVGRIDDWRKNRNKEKN